MKRLNPLTIFICLQIIVLFVIVQFEHVGIPVALGFFFFFILPNIVINFMLRYFQDESGKRKLKIRLLIVAAELFLVIYGIIKNKFQN